MSWMDASVCRTGFYGVKYVGQIAGALTDDWIG